MRLIKYTAGTTTYTLATTLLDRQRYSVRDLADLYHGRWSIEELYKISKQLLTVEEFHGQTERTVQQELFAHFSLIALARLFTNRSEESFRADPGKPVMQANSKSSLRTVARHLEGLFLEHAAMLGKTVERILAGIAACRQRQRPNRSFPRVVFQFVSVDFTKLFHELVRSLFELVHYCRRELRPGKGPVEPYVSVKLATVTLSCSSELIHKIPRPCIGII